MLFYLVPANMLSTTSDAYGGMYTGDTGMGFDIVDSYHSPVSFGDSPYSTSNHIDTAYGGGLGTGISGGGSMFAGGATPVADGTSPASYGTKPPYTDYMGTPYSPY